MSMIACDCLGVVLAGGLSARMGQDKAKLLRDNRSMLEFSKKALSDSGLPHIVVSGDQYDVPDKVKQSGPVGGILSVLARFPQVKSLLILPVDLPFITAKSLAELRLKGELSQKATYFQGHNIPLYLPNNAYLALFLGQAFSQGSSLAQHSKQASTHRASKAQFNAPRKKTGPSMRALLSQVPQQAIACSDANILFNSNTPEQWQQAKQHLNF